MHYSEQLSFYKENGVKIAIARSTLEFESECFRRYTLTSEAPNMADAANTCPKGLGHIAELLMLIMDILKLPRDRQFLVPLNHSDFGIMLTDGTWSGIIGDIMNGLYDTSFPVFTPLTKRLQAIDFSFPVLISHVSYTTRWPKNLPPVEVSPLSVFSFYLWTAIFTVGCLVGITIVIDNMVTSKCHQAFTAIIWQLTERAMESVLLFTGFAITVNSSHSKRFWLRGTQIVLGLWAMVAGIVASLYSGAILMKIVNQKPVLPFTDESSLAACVVARKCYLVTTSRSVLEYQRIVYALDLSEDEMKLHRAIQNNPIQVSWDIPNIIFNSNKNQYPVVISSKIDSDNFKATDKKHSRDDYYVVDGEFTDPWCFPTKKDSNLTAALSYAVHTAQAAGLIEEYSNYFLSTFNQGNLMSRKLPEPLNMDMLSGIYGIIIVGIACGFVLLMMEKVFWWFFPNKPQGLDPAKYWMIQCDISWEELRHKTALGPNASFQLQQLNETLCSLIDQPYREYLV